MAIRSIDRSLCINCGTCEKHCPCDVYGKFGNFVYIARPEDCITCYVCEIDCPVDCITVSPERERLVVFPFDPEAVKACEA